MVRVPDVEARPDRHTSARDCTAGNAQGGGIVSAPPAKPTDDDVADEAEPLRRPEDAWHPPVLSGRPAQGPSRSSFVPMAAPKNDSPHRAVTVLVEGSPARIQPTDNRPDRFFIGIQHLHGRTLAGDA